MDRSTLLAHAQDALGKLHHPALLEIHPLTVLLVADTAPANRGSDLKGALLDAMQELRPSYTVAFNSPTWRRYRSLCEFYLEGKDYGDVARTQGVSERQTRRDLHQALAELGDYLWARYCQLQHVPLPLIRGENSGESPLHEADNSFWETEIQRIGSLPPGPPIRVEAVVRDVMTLVERLADQLGTRTTLALAEVLPAVSVNQTALRQALLSIMGWILDSSPGGTIALSVAEAGRGVEVSIQVVGRHDDPVDDGDDYSRLRLGQRLLEIQGGTLEILANTPGMFRMRVVLPSAQTPAILVVDDNPDVVRLFQRYIQSPSLHLVQATTAEEALQLIRDVRPHLITLDLMMPVRDGWELLQLLTQDPSVRDIPIVVCSIVHERSLALAMGASYFLPKPVSRLALLQMLEQCGLGPMDRVQASS